MKVHIDLEVDFDNEELEDDDLPTEHKKVVDFLKDELLQVFVSHDYSEGDTFTVTSVEVTDTTSDE